MRAGRTSPWDPAVAGPACQPAGQGAGAGARRRHRAVRLARYRRVPRYGKPGVAADSRAEPAADRGQALGSACGRHLRCCGRNRARSRRPAGQEREQGVDRTPATKIGAGVAEMARRNSATSPGATATRIRWPTSRPAARSPISICAIRPIWTGARNTRTSPSSPKAGETALVCGYAAAVVSAASRAADCASFRRDSVTRFR